MRYGVTTFAAARGSRTLGSRGDRQSPPLRGNESFRFKQRQRQPKSA